MPEFCTCGAQLPPDARFCHKCGKPQYEYPPVQEDDTPPAAPVPVTAPPLVPTEISFGNVTAVRIGFLAALIAVLPVVLPMPFPFLRFTCAFFIAGFLAVYFYMRRTGQKVSLRGGARLGWMTGIFSFTIFMVQLTAASVLASSAQGGVAGAFKQALPPNDARTEQVLQALQEPSVLAVTILMFLFFLFLLLTVLPTLGGLLGAKVLAREH